MSELLKHECGIALIRLLKPIDYYYKKYGTWDWGIKKLYLLMEKQHNRGQDGAGLVSIKLNSEAGKEYIFRVRSNAAEPIKDVFNTIDKERQPYMAQSRYLSDVQWISNNMPYVGEVMMGHLRYGTFGKNDINSVHPVLRRSNWKSKALALQGNFNMTNVDEIFKRLLELGQHPREYSDTITILEKIGHFLDEENERIFVELRKKGYSKKECSPLIQKNIDIFDILRRSSKTFDGGYVISGIIGHGDAFVMRDPWGIRPAYYFRNDEVVVVTSERPVIQTVFDVRYDEVTELKPGYALVIRRDGQVQCDVVREPEQRKSCSFERIYFSRGSDKEIYEERKNLGRFITPKILKAIDYDLQNSVFSYIPNTAETAFLGMVKELETYANSVKASKISQLDDVKDAKKVQEILNFSPRVEKLAIKDIKLRTFITQDNERDDLVEHVYDVTYGIVKNTDNLVVIDDSIVRGTTLKKSIIKILARLRPRRIIIVSSAPQIRYPDCYGIDMADLENLIAFRAAVELLKEQHKENIIDEVYRKCKQQADKPKEEIINYVKEIYAPFSDEDISSKIAELLRPNDLEPELKIIYQSVADMHKAIPQHTGDWYFTGDYPTPGGNRVVNQAFINFYEGKKGRAY